MCEEDWEEEVCPFCGKLEVECICIPHGLIHGNLDLEEE